MEVTYVPRALVAQSVSTHQHMPVNTRTNHTTQRSASGRRHAPRRRRRRQRHCRRPRACRKVVRRPCHAGSRASTTCEGTQGPHRTIRGGRRTTATAAGAMQPRLLGAAAAMAARQPTLLPAGFAAPPPGCQPLRTTSCRRSGEPCARQASSVTYAFKPRECIVATSSDKSPSMSRSAVAVQEMHALMPTR